MDLNGVMIGSEDPQRLAAYYTKLFGEPGFSDGGFTGWQLGSAWVMVGAHDQVKGANPQPGRLIWNLESADVEADFERFKNAGATVVKAPYHPSEEMEGWIATLSDPDDNYFQLMSPMG
jgi:predicted enzyme related to lactoylglutathione lyase